MDTTVGGFLLSREWRERDSGLEIVLWARTPEVPVRARFSGLEAVMFVPRNTEARADRRSPRPLTTPDGAPVDALYFRSQRRLIDERDRIRRAGGVVLESDVKPHERFLMERFVTGALRLSGNGKMHGHVLHFENPKIQTADVQVALSVLALDLETDGFDGPILSAALATRDTEHVFVCGTGSDHGYIRFVPDEKTLLTRLFATIRTIDADVIAGWNIVDFDLTVLERRARELGVEFAIGRSGERARVLTPSSGRQIAVARVPGRVVLDGIAALKSATHRFERYTLDHVAREVLGRGKKIAPVTDTVAEIRRMHAEDIDALAAYNLEDCRLVLEIFDQLDLVSFAMERARLTGLPMDRQGGSVAAFDHLYLPRLHRRGVVAPDVRKDLEVVGSPGGHVLDSVSGLHRDVLLFDFRSLYPSIIRTFRIDPLALFPVGLGARAPEDAILPALIQTLHDERSRAMAGGNEALSRAIKILMNSFYGVLGTPGCRFFDARLPTSITRRGHEIIERSRAFFEAKGLSVIYGDTDSLFVHLAGEPAEAAVQERGRALAAELTALLAEEIRRDLDLPSYLELKFEAHYLRFLMPTTRGTTRGSKKRYAGWMQKRNGERTLVVRGLEAVRTDWTPLARRVQRELLRRVFADEPYESWLEEIARDLLRGALDRELTYTKVREDARVLCVMTLQGLEPAAVYRSPIDHDHYLTKQLAPACDVVLSLLGTSFEGITGTQGSLF